MVMAVAKALEAGARVDRLRLDRQHLRLGRGLRRGRRARGRRRPAGRQDRRRQAPAGAGRRGARARGARQLRRRAAAVRALAEQDEHPVTLVNSVNPFRLDGQKTAAFEVCDDLGRAPDILAIPVGNAGNISAYWMGFRAYREAGVIDRLPRMWGFQAAGAAPIVLGHPVEHPETFATAIRIGNPASWEQGDRRPRRVRRAHRGGHRRRDLRRLPRRRPPRRHLLRAGVGRQPGRRAEAAGGGPARPGRPRRLRADRARAEGPGQRGAGLVEPPLEADATLPPITAALGWR